MSELIDRERFSADMRDFQNRVGIWRDEAEDTETRTRADAALATIIETKLILDKQPTIPTPRWHRVEEELPVKREIVIVSDGKRTWDVGQYHCLVSSDDRTKWLWKGHTIKTVKWWMRKKDALPEPPKED